MATARALAAMGAMIERTGPGAWRVWGRGVAGLAEPDGVLDLGNAGTGVRLMLGIAAQHSFTAFFTGDASLRRRPMGRVAAPLRAMGARIIARGGDRLPLAITGATEPLPIEYRLPVPSAQIKSAILLAALAAPGATSVIEPEPTRDHTERMLRHFGAEVSTTSEVDGARRVTLIGQPELRPARLVVPGDPSSAAFPLVAALVTPGSAVTIEGVGINPLRTGLLETLRAMGADIALANARDEGGEPVADLVARSSALRGVEVPAARAPSMIDEYPVLAVAAACATGTTVMHGLAELKVKESDRLAAIVAGLRANGVEAEAGADSLTVVGTGAPPAGGGTVTTHFDHRIAMAFLVLGLAARRAARVDDTRAIATSFPDFVPLMTGLGAAFA
jgi:3-phosphoshikimate 1-carboxyvinyltransferase